MTTDIKAVIIDFKHVIDEFAKCRSMYWLYKHMSIRSIIERILNSESHEETLRAFILDCIDHKDDIQPNVENLEIFFDDLVDKTFFLIYQKSNRKIKNIHFVFDRWLDQTTAIFTVNGIWKKGD